MTGLTSAMSNNGGGLSKKAHPPMPESVIANINAKNPGLLNLPLVEIYRTVIHAFAQQSIVVIMDNHVSNATWCCGWGDENSWWGTFNVNQWISGLKFVAHTFSNEPSVVGYSLRNEPRGETDVAMWRSMMTRGVLAVTSCTTHALVIVGGINFATDLSFEGKNSSLSLAAHFKTLLPHRLVYEAHEYEWDNSRFSHPPTKSTTESICNNNRARLEKAYYFVTTKLNTPLIMSEWGTFLSRFDTNGSLPQTNWFNCFYRDLIEKDLHNSVWQLSPRYYIRQGGLASSESFCLTDSHMTKPKSSAWVDALATLKLGKSSSSTGGKRIVSTSTSRCLIVGADGMSAGFEACSSTRLNTEIWKIGTGGIVKHAASGMCINDVRTMKLASNCTQKSLSYTGFRLEIGSNCVRDDALNNIFTCSQNDARQWHAIQ